MHFFDVLPQSRVFTNQVARYHCAYLSKYSKYAHKCTFIFVCEWGIRGNPTRNYINVVMNGENNVPCARSIAVYDNMAISSFALNLRDIRVNNFTRNCAWRIGLNLLFWLNFTCWYQPLWRVHHLASTIDLY